MTPKEIIAEAWRMTTTVKPIRRWGFAAALLDTLFDVKLLIYQTYFAYSYFVMDEPIGFFMMEEILMKHLPMWGFITFIIVLIILLIIEIFLPKMCLGAIIGLAAKAHKKEEVRGGLVLALYNFFPILAIHEMFLLGKLTMVITVCSLILRYMVEGLQIPLIIFVFFIYAISNILRFFTSFAEEEVVIRKTGFLSALGCSFKLIISHLRTILFLLILMVVILIRVIINALVLLILPGAIIGLGLLLTYFFSITLTIIICTIVGILLVGLASYFFAYLHVFQQTVWTITYMELSKMKDLDIIGIEPDEKPSDSSVSSDSPHQSGPVPTSNPSPNPNTQL